MAAVGRTVQGLAISLSELRATLPPIFAGQSLDDLTGGAIIWRSILNAKARKEIPASCFRKSGRKVLVLRDSFLEWWGQTLRGDGDGNR